MHTDIDAAHLGLDHNAMTNPSTPDDSPHLSRDNHFGMKLLKRLGCFGPAPDFFRIERATTSSDLAAAYRLIQENNTDPGDLFPKAPGFRAGPHQANPENTTLVVKASGRIVGTAAIILDSDLLGLPADNTCKNEIDQLRQDGKRICQAGHWALTPDHRHTHVLTELLRAVFACAMTAENRTTCIIAINPAHQAFFKLLGFEILAANNNETVVCLPIDKIQKQFLCKENNTVNPSSLLNRFYFQNNLYHGKAELWAEDARAAFADPAFLRRLFVEHHNVLANCTPDELDLIRRFWGEEIFLTMIGHFILCDDCQLYA